MSSACGGGGGGGGDKASFMSPAYGKSDGASVRCRTQRRAAHGPPAMLGRAGLIDASRLRERQLRLTQIHGLNRISGRRYAGGSSRYAAR